MLEIIRKLLGIAIDIKALVVSELAQLKLKNPDLADVIQQVEDALLPKLDEALTEENLTSVLVSTVNKLKSGTPGENPQHGGLA